MEKTSGLFFVSEKTDALRPHRYGLVLLKVGCPVSCAEVFPVSKEFYDAVPERAMLKLTCTLLPMTPDESEKHMLANYPTIAKQDLKFGSRAMCGPGHECEEPQK